MVLGAAFLHGSTIGPAGAESRRIAATSYLRDGPGLDYRPVDEALAGGMADVIACGEGWCRVRLGRDRVGFVPEGAVATAAPEPAGGPSTCFVTREAAYEGGRDLRICYPRTAP